MIQNVSKSKVFMPLLILLLWTWTHDFFPPKSAQPNLALTAQGPSSEIYLASLSMWSSGKSTLISIVTSVLFNLGNSISLKLGKLDLILLMSILWYLTYKFGTANALSIVIFSGCELDDPLNETIFDWTLEELRRRFPFSNVFFSRRKFSMWAISSRISVASEPASRSAFVWTIFVPFVIIKAKICRNVLLNLKWLEVTVSFGLFGSPWWTDVGELVTGGGVTLPLCRNVWWRLLQLPTLHLCFDWQLFYVMTFSQAVPKKFVCFDWFVFDVYWTRYEVFTSCYFMLFGREPTFYFFSFTNMSCVYCL